MDTHPGWRTPLSALAIVAVACGTQDRLPTESSSGNTLANTQLSEITGRVLGPDGRNICRTVTNRDTMIVFASPQSFEIPLPEPVILACPENRFTFAVEPGDYRLIAQFFQPENLGNLPVAWILPPVTVGGGEVSRNIRYNEGTPLGGRATLNGEPYAGLVIIPVNEFNFGLLFGTGGLSDRNGRWDDASPVIPAPLPESFRSPFILQNDVEYIVFGECDFTLGTRIVETSFFQPFIFPTQRRRVDCELETGPARRFTHTRNQIAATAFPGDIGGLTGGVRDFELGTGFGVQFPSRPGRRPTHGDRTISELFVGGLMIGVGPATVLTGIDNFGYMECRFDLENGCRDVGLDARGEVNRLANGGRVVTWRYSDAPSGEGVGLRVTQRSFDAPAGEAYVLFRFTVRNGSNGRLNINPGIFTDFDVDSVFDDELGHRQRGGRLLSQTDAQDPHGTRVGTLMIGESDPAPGFWVRGDLAAPTIPEQIAALRGNRSNSADEPTDQRYIQSVRAIGLSPGAETDLWVAVIAAESDGAFADAADAASRDIRERRQRLLAGEAEPSGELEWSYAASVTPQTTPARRPVCGKDCMLTLMGKRAPAGSRLSAGLQHQRRTRE
jgi:hypothetical protein